MTSLLLANTFSLKDCSLFDNNSLKHYLIAILKHELTLIANVW